MDNPPFISESEDTEVVMDLPGENSHERNGVRGELLEPNIDPEQAFLGALLLNPRAYLEAEKLIRPEYFSNESHQVIYKAMFRLNEKKLDIDPVSLVAEMQSHGQLEISGGVPYLDELTEKCPTSINALTYAHIVERKALLRQLVGAAEAIRQMASEGRLHINDILDAAEQRIFKIGQARVDNDLTHIHEIMDDVLDQMKENRENQKTTRGLPTGFAQLDRLLGGLNKNDLLVLAARPGMGKTSFALTMALNAAARLESKVALFSLEMGKDQVAQRLLAMESNLNLHNLRIGELGESQWDLLEAASENVSAARIYVDDTPGSSVSDIRGKSRRLHAKVNLDLLVVDYMQLMSGSDTRSNGRFGENRQQEITYISSSLKNLARELGIPVVALSQLSRAVESRQEKRPMLQDLRESGSIEQDADVVMFLYRDDYYDHESLDQGLAELIVAKHRNGALGKVKFHFRKETTTFVELQQHPGGFREEEGRYEA